MKFLILCNLYCYVITTLAYLFFLIFCRGKIYGKDLIRRNIKSGFILAANHSSYFDWLVLIGLFKIHFGIKVKFLAKEKIYKHPILSPVAVSAGIRVYNKGNSI